MAGFDGEAARTLQAMLPPSATGLLAAVMPGAGLCSSLSRSTSVWSMSTSATCGGGVLSRAASIRVQPIIGSAAKDGAAATSLDAEPIQEEDELDQNVFRYLRENPRVAEKHTLVRKQHGVYNVDGREVQMKWQSSFLDVHGPLPVVVDGPLRQPLADYVEMSESSAEYEEPGVEMESALHSIPRERRLSFDDEHKKYSRLEAMKVAKEQALVRAKAAEHIKDGRAIPVSLLEKYNRTIEKMGPMSVEEVLDRCRWTPSPAGVKGGC